MNFLTKYDNKKNIRFDTFKFTLEKAYERNLKLIVETGVSRGKIKFFFFRKLSANLWKFLVISDLNIEKKNLKFRSKRRF